MRFSIQHLTSYRYGSLVSDSFNDAHLCPISDTLQTCESFELNVEPSCGRILRRLDFYTNQVHHFEVMQPHDRLDVLALSTVKTLADSRDFSVVVPFSSLTGLDRDDRYYDFLSASHHIALPPMMEHEAKEITYGSVDVREAVLRILDYIDDAFTYAPGSTKIESSVVEVFEQKAGVCQDFAHLMIALCRALKIPARYVSGYFYPEKRSLSASDDNTVSHAWVECFMPGIGWVGYDPTHKRRTGANYVRVAVGRDYSDVRPLSGTYRGKSQAEMKVSVSVEPMD